MNMRTASHHGVMFLFAFALIAALFGALSGASRVEAAMSSSTIQQAAAQPPSDQSPIIPLPGGCIRGTPGNDAAGTVCCISGLVYFNGEPVRGADVTIQSPSGQITVQTDLQLDTEERPYYRQLLSGFPLSATVGTVITLTARFDNYTRTLTHTVESDSQQVDFALAPNVLGFASQVQGEPAEGKFNNVMDVALDSQGRIYGTDWKNFRVVVFGPDGRSQGEWGRLGNLPAEFGRPMGIAVDTRTDTIYVVDRDMERVLQYTAAGDLLAVWDSSRLPANRTRLAAPRDVAVDDEGNVYILSRTGIVKLDANGNFLDHFGAYSDGSTDRGDMEYLAAAPQGNVYVPDPMTKIIHRFNRDGVVDLFPTRSVTGTFVFSNPGGVAVDESSRVYVYDKTQRRVFVFAPDGLLTQTLLPDLAHPAAQSPGDVRGIDVYGGSLYLAAFDKNRILKFDLGSGALITAIGGADDNPNQVERPYGIAAHAGGELFVTEVDQQRLALIVGDEVTKSWMMTDLGLYPASLVDVAVKQTGEVWLADFAHGLRRLAFNGSELVTNGAWDAMQPGNLDFCHPSALDLAGDYIFVADSCGGGIFVLRPVTSALQVMANFNGDSQSGPLSLPYGIAVDDATATVYVTDLQGHRVLKLHFTGSALEYIGSWGEPGEGAGQFNQPWSILVGGDRALYVSDHGNHRVQKFDFDGNWLATYGQTGVGPGAMLNPTGLAMDDQGALFVADETLGRVQRFARVAISVPVATIVRPPPATLRLTDTLTAIGQGQDSDATNVIKQYEWSSNRQGVLSNNADPNLSIAASALVIGAHIISLRVQDDEGEWSAPVSVRIYVAPPPTNAQCEGESWTFMLYLVGDFADGGALDRIFNGWPSGVGVIDRLSSISNPCVGIAVQVDGSASLGTAVNDTRRLFYAPGQSFPMVEMIGEQEMDASLVLSDFISASQNALPAQHYYLAIADHGQGVLGIGWDHTTDYLRNPPNIDNDAYLTIAAIKRALDDERLAPIDILHLDACSMNLLETAYELRHNVDYLVASQYLAWSIFAYDDYARLVDATTPTSPAVLARGIVNRYAARAEGAQVPYTLSALNLDFADEVKRGVDALAVLLRGWVEVDVTATDERQAFLLALRNASQTLDSDGEGINSEQDRYVDLYDWVQRVLAAPEVNNSDIKAAAAQLLTTLQTRQDDAALVLANRAGSNRLYTNNADIDLARVHGVSIYFPHGHASPSTTARGAGQPPAYGGEYTDYIANELFGLTRASRWNEFLVQVLGAPVHEEQIGPQPPPLAPAALPPHIFLPLVMG